MKRIIALFLTFIVILISGATAVSAAEGDTILKGTPAVDGVKDDIYSQSMSEELGEQFYKTGDADGNITGKLWALYDDKYLYIYAEIYGSDFQAADPDYVKDTENPWESNCVEIWVDESGEGDNAGKFSLEYDGSRYFYDASRTDIDPDKTQYAAGTISGGYSIELAIEFPAGAALAEGKPVGIAFQANEYHKSEDSTSAFGSQVPTSYVLGGAVVVQAAPEPDPDPEPAPTPEPDPEVPAPAPAQPETPQAPAAPKTGDAAVGMLAMVIIAGAALAVSKKTSKNI